MNDLRNLIELNKRQKLENARDLENLQLENKQLQDKITLYEDIVKELNKCMHYEEMIDVINNYNKEGSLK